MDRQPKIAIICINIVVIYIPNHQENRKKKITQASSSGNNTKKEDLQKVNNQENKDLRESKIRISIDAEIRCTAIFS